MAIIETLSLIDEPFLDYIGDMILASAGSTLLSAGSKASIVTAWWVLRASGKAFVATGFSFSSTKTRNFLNYFEG